MLFPGFKNITKAKRIDGFLIFILTGLFFLIPSCSPDPSVELLESYSFSFENEQGKRLEPGASINVVLTIYNNKEPVPEPFRIVFNVIEGGGSVSQETFFTNDESSVTTTWTLGTNSLDHKLRASVFKRNGDYLTSTDLTAITFRENAWDAVSTDPDGRITGMVADTIAGITLMVTNGNVYKQGSRYFLWEQVVHQVLDSPRTIEMDSNGTIYVSTWSGEVLKSTDHGESWKKCTKPYPDHPYYIYMHVSNDNYIWVFKFDYPTKFSGDGGITWQTAGSDLSSYGFGDVFRLKNGTLLFHGSNCCSLSRSDDNGLTWSHIETPGNSHKLYVNDREEIFICNQESGFTILKSTDMGATYRSLFNCSPQFGTTMDNIFNRWGSTYYILVPGFGILKSDDLEHYETYWINRELNNLFIDHNGVLIAKDWNNNTVYYRKNSK